MATSRISHTITLLLIAFSTLPVSPIITQVPPISGVALGGRVYMCTWLLRTMKAFAREWSPHGTTPSPTVLGPGVFWECLLKE